MVDFNLILDVDSDGMSKNPFAHRKGVYENGNISYLDWQSGHISVNFLNNTFGKYKTADEMINATDSEGLKKYFKWLNEEGILN